MIKASKLLTAALTGAIIFVPLLNFAGDAHAQRRRARPRRGVVCGNPTDVRCGTDGTFQPYDLPFMVPRNPIIWESEFFYAIVLRSAQYTDQNCEQNVIPERERLETQAIFPNNKVFATRCLQIAEGLYYTGLSGDMQFMAVYAGRTRAQAARMLARVRATGRFPGANIRRMSAGFNRT